MTETTSTTTVLTDSPCPADGPPTCPATAHMWVMVLGDMVIFGGYFLIYMVHRAMAPEAFLAAQTHLNVTIGVVNTIVLLTSSLFVARSVYAARSGRPEQAIRLTYAGGALRRVVRRDQGLRMVGRTSAEGCTVANEFFSFYYVLTGVHMLHVALGLIILGVCVRELRVRQTPTDIPGGAGSDVLAHGRSALGRHLRASLRDEVNS